MEDLEGGVVEDLDAAISLGDEEVLGRVGIREGGLVGLTVLFVASEDGWCGGDRGQNGDEVVVLLHVSRWAGEVGRQTDFGAGHQYTAVRGPGEGEGVAVDGEFGNTGPRTGVPEADAVGGA